MRHNFVASYNYDLPFERLFDTRNGWTDGLVASPARRGSAAAFRSRSTTPTDTSLLGTFGNGVNNNLLDTPNYTPGCDLKINHDPTKGAAFNTACFSAAGARPARQRAAPVLLRPGHREHRPGAASRTCRSGSAQRSQFRLEAFNVFNHAQFYGAGAVDGNIASPTFGQIVTRRGAAADAARREVHVLVDS